MFWLSLIPLAVSLALSLTLCRAMIAVGRRWQLVDKPGHELHKQEVKSISNLGGVAIYLAMALPMAGGLALAWGLPMTWWEQHFPALAVHVPGLRHQTPLAIALLTAMSTLHILGLIDDRIGLGPGAKLLVQLGVGTALAGWFDVRIFEFLDTLGPGGRVASILLSALWLAGITNAMNMLDNMDGLAGGVAGIIAAVYLVVTLVGGQWFVAGACAMLLGSVLGFLWFNRWPAKIYMGDAGSLVIGLLLGVLSVRTTYLETNHVRIHTDWYVLLMPLLVMAVPLYDMVSVSIIRIRMGRRPWRGDRNHVSHRLVRAGFTVPMAVWLICNATLLTGIAGVLLAVASPLGAIGCLVLAAGVLSVLRVLESGGKSSD